MNDAAEKQVEMTEKQAPISIDGHKASRDEKFEYEACGFREGQPVGLKVRKARLRLMRRVDVVNKEGIKESHLVSTGQSIVLKKGRDKITFVAPRYTYGHPFITRTNKREEIEKNSVKKDITVCKIPHAYVEVGGKFGSIDMCDLEAVFEQKDWSSDPHL